MDGLLLKELLGLACIIEIIVQIVLLIRFKVSENARYWEYFVGMASVSIVFDLLYGVLSDGEMGLSEGLITLFIGAGCLVFNIILFAIGLAVKRTVKRVDTMLNKNILLAGGVVLVINGLLLVLEILGEKV